MILTAEDAEELAEDRREAFLCGLCERLCGLCGEFP